MKKYYSYVVVIIFTGNILGTLSNDYNFPIMDTNLSDCKRIYINQRPHSFTIIVEVDEHDSASFSHCFITGDGNAKKNTPLIMLYSEKLPGLLSKLNQYSFLNRNPHIYIFTNTIDNRTYSILAILIKSSWSLVNIIITDEKKHSCEEGKLKNDVYRNIEHFFHKLWHTHQVVNALVQFPHACPQKIVLYDGGKRPTGGLYDRTVVAANRNEAIAVLENQEKTLAHGYPLKANLFYRFPTSITQCDKMDTYVKLNKRLTNGYCGMDALVMQDVIHYFKFNVSFPETSIGSYGYMKSGRVSGSLGAVIRGEIDISFNSRFLVSYVDGGFDFLRYISYDSLCALMREPDAVPLWYYPFNIYTGIQWIMIILCLTLMGLVVAFKAKMTQKMNEKVLQMHDYVINFLWAGLFGFFFSKRIRRSILAASCLLCSVVISAKYQGHVNYMFATLVRYSKFRSLQDMQDNNVQIYTSQSIVHLLRGQNDSSNNAKESILSRLIYHYQTPNMSRTDYVLLHPDAATLDRRSDVMLEALVNFTDKHGRPTIYVVNDCIQNYYLSYIVRSEFPFTKDLQIFMTRLVEAGLPDAYYRWTRYMFSLTEITCERGSEPRPIVKISLQEERVPFFLLFLGYFLSTAVFIVEKWWNTCMNNAIPGVRENAN